MNFIRSIINNCTWFADCTTPEEWAESNLEFGYRGMMVVIALALLKWGGVL